MNARHTGSTAAHDDGGGWGDASATKAAADAVLTEVFDRYRGDLYRFCVGKTGDPATAEDIVQEVFLRLHTGRARIESSKPAWPFLLTIAIRACIDAHRRKCYAESRLPVVGLPATSLVDDTEATVLARFDCETLTRAVDALPPRQRTALQLFALDGWSYAEVAEHFGVSPAIVKSLIQRARARLRESTAGALGAIGGAWRAWRSWLHGVATRVPGAAWSTLPSPVAAWHQGAVVAGATALLLFAGTMPEGGSAGAAPTAAPAAADARDRPEGRAPGFVQLRQRGELTSPATTPPPRPRLEPVGAERLVNAATEPLVGEASGAPPEEGHYGAVAASPSYEHDGTVVASGSGLPDHGAIPSKGFAVSRDGGATWQRRRALGFGGASRILFAPAYPHDDRIFTIGVKGLQVTSDDGETFETLVPTAALDGDISPAFDAGDPRLLLVTGGGQLQEFDYETNMLRPVELGVAAAGAVVDAARFERSGGAVARIVVAGHRPRRVTSEEDLFDAFRVAKPFVARCARATVVTSGARAPERADLPVPVECEQTDLPDFGLGTILELPDAVSPSGPVFVGQAWNVTVVGGPAKPVSSTHGAYTTASLWSTRVQSIPGGDGLGAVAAGMVGARGPVLMRTDDGGRSWSGIVIPLARFVAGAMDLSVAPTGRMFALGWGGGIACSADGGATWAPRCPSPEPA